MAARGEFDIDQLKRDLDDAGYAVVNVGKRYRVTNPAGGDPVFIPQSLPKNGRATSIEDVKRMLNRIGYTDEQAAAAREAKRQERLLEAQREGEAALLRAQAEADDRPAPAAVQEVIRQRISPEMTTTTPGDPRTEIITMTPDFAADLLKHNRFYNAKGVLDGIEQRTNRPFRIERAERFRDVILSGRWRLTHQGVALDTDGILVDGQHRLVGLVMAGEHKPDVSVRMMVTYDLEPEAFDAVDIGGKRTVGDVLSSHGIKQGPAVGAVARLVIFCESGGAPGEWHGAQIDPEQALMLLRARPELAEDVRWGSYRPIGLPAAEGAARHLILRANAGDGRDAAVQFLSSYRTGADVSEHDPALTLRNVLLGQAANRKRKRDSLEQFALIIKAWNANVRGKKQKVLAWRYTEDVPKVIGLR